MKTKHINLILVAVLAAMVGVLALQPSIPWLGGQPRKGIRAFQAAVDSTGDKGEVNEGLKTVKMKIGTREFVLEVADTEETRQLGLMNRKSMPDDHGMLFVFEEEEPLSFWMKNTLIPLDILYINAKGKVVTIDHMKPKDIQTKHPSKEKAMYAIELNEGMAKKAGVKEGDVLTIPKLD